MTATDIRSGHHRLQHTVHGRLWTGRCRRAGEPLHGRRPTAPAQQGGCRGRDAIRAFWQGALDAGLTEATLDTVEVDSTGDTAVEVGRYTLRAKGGQVADAGKYVVVWKREGGGWKLHRDIWNTQSARAE